MNIHEHQAKQILKEFGAPIAKGAAITALDQAEAAVASLPGPVWVVKSQIHAGGRGKGKFKELAADAKGGVRVSFSAEEALENIREMFGKTLVTQQTGPSGKAVNRIYVEDGADIDRELYLSILVDRETGKISFVASTEGGMDIEEIAAKTPEKLRKASVDVRHGFVRDTADQLVNGLDLSGANDAVAETLVKLYEAYATNDAELLEINPLVLTGEGDVMALDCKFVMDDSAIKRQEDLAPKGTPDKLTGLESIGEGHGIKYIELEGNVVVLANGAGLTMTTMDVVRHYGGQPANFCEIGGEAYTKGKAALAMVLARVEDADGTAVDGIKGVSLFLLPRTLATASSQMDAALAAAGAGIAPAAPSAVEIDMEDICRLHDAAVAANIHDPTEENFITVAVFGAVEYSVTNVCASGDVAHTDVPTAGTPFACDETKHR